MNPELTQYRERLRCNVERIDEIFPGALSEAREVFTEAGLAHYLDGASAVCALGRGQELVLLFIEGIPEVGRRAGEAIVPEVVETVRVLSRSTNAKAINPFLSTLPFVARRLSSPELMRDWLALVEEMARKASEGLVSLLTHSEFLLTELSLGGVKNWMEHGLRGYRHEPWRFGDWFSLQTADSRAAFRRERHGTLYADHERRIAQYLQALWNLEIDCHPYSTAFDTLRKGTPHLDKKGLHFPEVYDDFGGVRGIDRYRALLAHMVAHKRWTQPFIADNFNRYQQMAMETFEDARVEYLAMQCYPGLRNLWLRLHPIPKEGDCPPGWSCIRHKLAILSRALLDPEHPCTDPAVLEFASRFHERVSADPHDVRIAPELGVAYIVKVHEVDFRSPKIYFEDTDIGYRDDNRFLWIFLEDTDDEDEFHSDHNAANPREDEAEQAPKFVRHLKEWDFHEQHHKPDWVTVYESVPEGGDPSMIDALMEKHRALAKQLHRIVDLLKPQQQVRIRYQEEGDELDLDIAIRALIDHRAGSTPDPRIHFSHRTDGRDIVVTLLLDLSESVKSTPPGAESSILQLSQEAVSLLAGAIDTLGDPFSIAGFASNTRHEVHYLHLKGFNEPWGPEPKGRIAGMQGRLSTRMGAAVRTAGQYLSRRPNERKLLLVLTDGEPHDIDVSEPEYLRADTKKAVEELSNQGITTYCITLDPDADEYVADIFGQNHYTVIDHITKLPEKLPALFMALTK